MYFMCSSIPIRTCELLIIMVTANVGGCSTRQERRKTAALNYDKGKSRHPYSLKRDIKKGMALIKLPNKVCDDCQGLSDLKDIFNACKHSGPTLCKRKVLKVKISFF